MQLLTAFALRRQRELARTHDPTPSVLRHRARFRQRAAISLSPTCVVTDRFGLLHARTDWQASRRNDGKAE
jgi:hypothetical protein